MELNWRTAKSSTVILTTAICLALVLQGFTANAGVSENQIDIGTPHAVTGYVYWPNGTIEDTVAIPVSVTNNRTGETGVVLVDVIAGGNPNGTYQIDLADSIFYPSGYLATDTIYVNCTYQNMWAKNETTVGGLPFSPCDLQLMELPLGPKNINASSGGSVTGFNGTVTLDVPPGALGIDTIIYGTNTSFARPGSPASINLGPDGTTFNPPATLKWSYAGLDLGGLSPQALKVYTFIGMPGSDDKSAPQPLIGVVPIGYWEELPSTVNVQTKQVIAQVSHFSNFSMGGASIVGFQTNLSHTYQGTTNVPILDLAITDTDLFTADTLDYIHVVSNCTSDLDVTGVSLWNDTNDNAAIDGADMQLGVTQALIGGNTNFTGIGEIIPANTTLNVLVCLDVNASAVIGDYLDLLIPMNGVGLANAGLNLEAIDPAGNTSIMQELTDPHVVYGYVSNIFGNVSNAWVNLTNNRTGTTENLMTDSLGRYDVNLGLMNGGYLANDTIFVAANDTWNQTGWNTAIVNVSQFGERCDVYVGQGPVASNETPANGLVIADLTRNITINITTPGTYALNTSTIVLEVEGSIYTMANGNLTFSGNTLTFNTPGALGNWTSGQIVNVTLLAANDTLGNPCENAPYVWAFSIMVNAVGRPANLTLSKNSSAVMLKWDSVQYADSYNIYRSSDRFAAWPWTKIGNNVTATNWTDAPGTYNDVNAYFYIVTAWNPAGEGGNSSMGSKIRRTFTYNDPTLNTNTNWVSLPYNSNYSTLIDIVNDIEGGSSGAGHAKFISGIYIWNAASQGVVGLTGNNFTGWFGNMAINPGDAIRLELSSQMSVGQTFGWTIVGTDIDSVQNFTYINPALNTNTNWISIPYSSSYSSMLDIVSAIENGTSGPGHARYISGIYIWNAATQGVVGLTGNNFTGWFGNMAIQPGDAIRLELSSQMTTGQQFSWVLDLLTAPVPQDYYFD